ISIGNLGGVEGAVLDEIAGGRGTAAKPVDVYCSAGIAFHSGSGPNAGVARSVGLQVGPRVVLDGHEYVAGVMLQRVQSGGVVGCGVEDLGAIGLRAELFCQFGAELDGCKRAGEQEPIVFGPTGEEIANIVSVL